MLAKIRSICQRFKRGAVPAAHQNAGQVVLTAPFLGLFERLVGNDRVQSGIQLDALDTVLGEFHDVAAGDIMKWRLQVADRAKTTPRLERLDPTPGLFRNRRASFPHESAKPDSGFGVLRR